MPPSELSEPSDSEEPSDCEEKWSDNDEVDNELLVEDDSEPEEEIQFVGISLTAKVLARWLTLFLMQIHSQYKVPESAVSRLFSFLFTFFCVLGSVHPLCSDIAKVFPRTVYRAKLTFAKELKFVRYVTCPRCKKIYHKVDCVNSAQKPKNCSHIHYPSHPQR